MYSITDLEKLFKRFLKERGEYDKIKKTTIIEHFSAQMRDLGQLPIHNCVVHKPRLTKVPTTYRYQLHDFYQYMYKADGGAFLEEVAEMFDVFLKERHLDEVFVDELNRMFTHPIGSVYAKKKEVLQGNTIVSGFYLDADHIDDVKSYVRAKTLYHPASLYRNAYPWAYANKVNPNNNMIAATWSLRMVRQIRDEDERRKGKNVLLTP